MPTATKLAQTGVPGLDHILCGGLPRHRIYLLQGDPGVGKTTIGLQFLLEGVAHGERCLYIALSETKEEIEAVVRSHNWDVAKIEIIELSALDQSQSLESENTLFDTAEVELHETTRLLLARIEASQPDRVVFDSLSELRLLAQNALRYRRQILGLKQFFGDKQTTVLLLDDRTSEPGDQQLQSLAHGVIELEQHATHYGEDRRRIRIRKLRGVRFRSGHHDFNITTGGCVVFPRISATQVPANFAHGQVTSGVAELDHLVGGGLDVGTSTLLIGPAGSGKSTIAVQYVIAAAARGERAAMFIFDERINTLYTRTRSLGIDLEGLVEKGLLTIQQVDPAEMGAGEFAHCVRHAIEKDGARVLVIDSLNGYVHAMANEKQLVAQMHELLSYLAARGVTTMLVMAQHGLLGTMNSPVDLSYLADNVLLLRYFEAGGRIRKAISVIKKRSGAHENAIRELTLDRAGIHVGEPLEKFTGVLTGVPTYEGDPSELTR